MTSSSGRSAARRVRLNLPDGLPPARVDANQLELAILNLAINARDAMPDGGSISRSEPSRAQPDGVREFRRPAAISAFRSPSTLAPGMDAESSQKAVEPFFSTKPLGKGTGLGLSMGHGLAVQLRGALRLDSAPGQGTSAELWLPSTRSTRGGKHSEAG